FFDGNELPIGASNIVFDPILNTATFTPATPLLEDTYRVELVGTGPFALTDVQGVRLDGEFRGYPSGDGFPGGDFVGFFAVQIAPRVTGVVARTTGVSTALDSQFPPGPSFILPTPPTAVDVTFSEMVTIPVGSFRLTAVGPDLVFGSADDL